MAKFKVTESYSNKIWFTKVYECEASDEDSIFEGKFENEKIISEKEIEKYERVECKIEDIEEIK